MSLVNLWSLTASDVQSGARPSGKKTLVLICVVVLMPLKGVTISNKTADYQGRLTYARLLYMSCTIA